MTTSITPTPRTWTLKFKHNRTTVFLHVDPLQKLSAIRDDLFHSITQTHPDGRFHDFRIPESSDGIVLGRLVDPSDLQSGWVRIGEDDDEGLFDEDEEGGRNGKRSGKTQAKGKGKGKGKEALGKTRREGPEETPRGLGLSDGAILAFKFRGSGKAGIDDGDADDMVVDGEDDEWDVVAPNLDDLYGDGEEDGGMEGHDGLQG